RLLTTDLTDQDTESTELSQLSQLSQLGQLPRLDRLDRLIQFEPFGAEHEAAGGDDAVADLDAFDHGEAAINFAAESDGPELKHTGIVRLPENNLPARNILNGGRRNDGHGPLALAQGPERDVHIHPKPQFPAGVLYLDADA